MEKNSPTYSKLKLWAVVILTLIAFSIAAGIGFWLMKLSLLTVLIVVLLPVITAFIYFFKNGRAGDTIKSLLTGSKIRLFPLFLFYDPEPVRFSRFKPAGNWWEIIEEGDLLLRRHDNYIDGLILRQACFFTHAGIATKEGKDKISVYHALGTGIHKVDITEFAHCDDIMVLRITEENIKKFLTDKPPTGGPFLIQEKTGAIKQTIPVTIEEIPIIPHSESRKTIKSGSTVSSDQVRQMIEESGRKLELDPNLVKRELQVYDLLTAYDSRILNEQWQTIITSLASAYYIKGIPYDFDFNFLDPNRMSCVEFAWNCYKSFFPMHHVKREQYTFFSFIKALILTPDLFFFNEDKFTCIYTSGEHFENRAQLKNFSKKSYTSFWWLIAQCVICQLLIMLIISYLKYILLLI